MKNDSLISTDQLSYCLAKYWWFICKLNWISHEVVGPQEEAGHAVYRPQAWSFLGLKLIWWYHIHTFGFDSILCGFASQLNEWEAENIVSFLCIPMFIKTHIGYFLTWSMKSVEVAAGPNRRRRRKHRLGKSASIFSHFHPQSRSLSCIMFPLCFCCW